MRTFLRPRHTPIAIDVQTDSIVAIQLAQTNTAWRPVVSAMIRRAPAQDTPTDAIVLSDTELNALERALARQGATGRSLVLMAPPATTSVELLELPPRAPGMPIDELARAEMQRLTRWDEGKPFQLVTWDVPPPLRRAAGNAQADTSLYAAALPESSVNGLIAQLSARGWSVQSILPTPITSACAARLQSPADDGASVAVVVDVRWDRAALTLARSGTALYHRDLPDNGLALLARALVADLGMSAADASSAIDLGSIEIGNPNSRATPPCEAFAEALAAELEASLAFASRRYGAAADRRLVLVGAGSRVGGLSDWLRSRLGIAAGSSNAPQAPASEQQRALCVALAVAASGRKHGYGLLPASERELARRQETARRWAVSAAAAAAIGLASLAGLYLANVAPTRGDDARLAGLEREQKQLDAKLLRETRELAQARASTSFRERLIHQPDYSALLRLIGGTMDASTTLRELSLFEPAAARQSAPALRRMRLVGTAREAADLTDQVAALRALDVFANVELARTSRSADGRGVSFELALDVIAPVPRAQGTD